MPTLFGGDEALDGKRRAAHQCAQRRISLTKVRSPLLSPKKPEKPDPRPRELVSDRDARAILGNISAMTALRWRGDPKVGFPQAVIVRGRRYYVKRDVEDFVDRLIEASASGAATTVSPLAPRRRRAAKAAGGDVTG